MRGYFPLRRLDFDCEKSPAFQNTENVGDTWGVICPKDAPLNVINTSGSRLPTKNAAPTQKVEYLFLNLLFEDGRGRLMLFKCFQNERPKWIRKHPRLPSTAVFFRNRVGLRSGMLAGYAALLCLFLT
jgi:hypothetical protein